MCHHYAYQWDKTYVSDADVANFPSIAQNIWSSIDRLSLCVFSSKEIPSMYNGRKQSQHRLIYYARLHFSAAVLTEFEMVYTICFWIKCYDFTIKYK